MTLVTHLWSLGFKVNQKIKKLSSLPAYHVVELDSASRRAVIITLSAEQLWGMMSVDHMVVSLGLSHK